MTTRVFAIRRRIYLTLVNVLRLPRRAATAIVKRIGLWLSPRQAQARRHARAPLADPVVALEVPDDKGYRLFGPNDFPGTDRLVRACREIFQREKASGRLDARVAKVGKRFLVQVTETPLQLMQNRAIQDFLLSDVMAATGEKYFGCAPLIAGLELFWSPSNDTFVRSQKYHFDAEDYRQLKIFVNIEDVTPDCGPFTFVGARRSAEVCAKTGYVGGRHARLDDEAVEAALAPEDIVVVTAPAGSGVICDTSRCLHYGSRGNRQDRLVFMCQLIDYFAPKLQPLDWSPVVPDLKDRVRPPQRLLLVGTAI
jgi:hypothetical protein